jgi:probable phosphoglycerate mutase
MPRSTGPGRGGTWGEPARSRGRWEPPPGSRYATHVVTAPEDQPQAGIYRQNRFRMPPGAAELFLVRHGESEPASLDVPFPLVDGRSDPALSPEGCEQAQQVATRLALAGVDAIYVTTLRRTAQTAAPLAARLGLIPRVEPGLREVGLGDWEGGLFRKMVAENHPTAMRMWEQESFEVIPGAEPATAFASRVREAIGRVAGAHPGGRVAVFTHGGVIGQALALATGSRPFAFITSDNASISRLVVAGERWVLRGFNDVTHLGH